MSKNFFTMFCAIGMPILFILGFWFGFSILNLPLMACMYAGAGLAVLALLGVIAKDNS